MNNGTVKFFNSIRGFGFIKNDETGEDIFVHKSALMDGLTDLQENQKVTYEVEKDPKNNKDRAINVAAISAD